MKKQTTPLTAAFALVALLSTVAFAAEAPGKTAGDAPAVAACTCSHGAADAKVVLKDGEFSAEQITRLLEALERAEARNKQLAELDELLDELSAE